MGSFFASFVDWLIGSPGRFVVNLIEDNMLIFMFVVMIYAPPFYTPSGHSHTTYRKK